MEFFKSARVVRFRSHHDKFLVADEDEESVCQDRDGALRSAKWTVEFVENSKNLLRFKSFYGKYLTASNMPFRLGLRGKKVIQTLPKKLDSSVEWEPIRENYQVRLKTPNGQFLRANGGVPPWRNSVTHDAPQRSAKQDWVLWYVDIVEIHFDSPDHPSAAMAQPTPVVKQPPPVVAQPPPPPPPHEFSADTLELSPPPKIELRSPRIKQESGDLFGHGSPMKNERMIYYHVADDKGEVNDDGTQDVSFSFKGSGVEELKKKLIEETGIEEINVCSRNPLNGQLYPLRLHLPPNNHDMHVVVVPLLSEDMLDAYVYKKLQSLK